MAWQYISVLVVSTETRQVAYAATRKTEVQWTRWHVAQWARGPVA